MGEDEEEKNLDKEEKNLEEEKETEMNVDHEKINSINQIVLDQY